MKFLRSKTVWFNALMVIVVVLNEINGSVVPPEYATAGIAVANALIKIFNLREMEKIENKLTSAMDEIYMKNEQLRMGGRKYGA